MEDPTMYPNEKFALFARQFTLARETCRTRIGGLTPERHDEE
jgi:hypothetical protein